MPLNVVVAEVEALQQAATRLRTTAESLGGQIAQLEAKKEMKMQPNKLKELEATVEQMTHDALCCLVSPRLCGHGARPGCAVGRAAPHLRPELVTVAVWFCALSSVR